MDGWVTRSNVIFNSNSVISGGWVGNDKTLFVMEPRLHLTISLSSAGFESWTQENYQMLINRKSYIYSQHLRFL